MAGGVEVGAGAEVGAARGAEDVDVGVELMSRGVQPEATRAAIRNSPLDRPRQLTVVCLDVCMPIFRSSGRLGSSRRALGNLDLHERHSSEGRPVRGEQLPLSPVGSLLGGRDQRDGQLDLLAGPNGWE